MSEVKENNEFPLFVTYVDCHGPLLRIRGHMDKKSVVQIEEMLTSIVNRLDNLKSVNEQILSPNMLCCVKFQPKRYYRARLCSPVQNGSVVVELLDYGNIENAAIENVKFLTNTPEAHVLQMPILLKTFVLANVAPLDDCEWSQDKLQYIKSSMVGQDTVVKYLGQFQGCHLIKLKKQDYDFATSLIEKKMANYASIEAMFRYFKAYNLKHTKQSMPVPVQPRIESAGVQYEAPTMQPSIKMIQTTETPQPNFFKSRILEIGRNYDVYVSHIEDGPHKFSVQLLETGELLTLLMKEINCYPLEPLREPPLPGTVCVGRYSSDQVLCRAVVMTVTETKCKVYYVDFGHTDVLSYSDIYQLPDKYIDPRVLSIRFTLRGIKNWNITTEVKEYFKNYVTGKSLRLLVCEPEGPPLLQYGTLYDNDKDIKDILLEQFPNLKRVMMYQEPTKLCLGQSVTVHVAYVESCKNFFVQLEEDADALDRLMNHIATISVSLPPLSASQLTVGTPCIAMYELDKQWYRAQIISVNGNSVKVLYVDYGNEESVKSDALKAINNDLIKVLRCQAIKCSLNGFQGQIINPEISSKFENLVIERSFIMIVEQVLTDSYIVDLQDLKNRRSIVSQLKADVQCEPLNSNSNLQCDKLLEYRRVENEWKLKGQLQSQPKTKPDFNKPYNKTFDEETSTNNQNWKDDNERKQDKMKKALNLNTMELRGRDRSFSNRDDRFTRKDVYLNEYDEKNTFRSDKDFRSNKLGFSKQSSPSGTEKPDNFDSCSKIPKQRFGTTDQNTRHSRNSWVNKGTEQSIEKGKKRDENVVDYSSKVTSFTSQKQQDENRNTLSPLVIKPLTIKIGSIHNCEISFIETPSEFYLNLFEEKGTLDFLMQQISAIYTTGGNYLSKSMIKPNTPCLAQYAVDSKWYRAIIKRVNDPMATIYFVDYGNEENVDASQLKEMNAEIAKPLAQAIPCKMFGVVEKSVWHEAEMKAFCDLVSSTNLQVEFINYKDNVYHVLLRQINDTPIEQQPYINQTFAPGVDLVSEKNKKIESATDSRIMTEPAFSCFTQQWRDLQINKGLISTVIISWFENPLNFYCQLKEQYEEQFKSMMKKMQNVYTNYQPVKEPIKVNLSVIAIFNEDGAFYRATIEEINVSKGKHRVQYIDFGNSDIVNAEQIYSVEEQFADLPKQAFKCSLKGILPPSENNWTHDQFADLENCFNEENFDCIVHDCIDGKYQVSLTANGKDIAEILIQKGLAISSEVLNTKTQDEPSAAAAKQMEPLQLDISLLVNQTLMVIVSNVDAVNKFHIQLPSADICQNSIANYMAAGHSGVLPHLSRHEVCPLAGCLIFMDGTWRRAVVIENYFKTAQVNVKLIDTGAYHNIHMDRMLALPGELALMQNQAIECYLDNVEPSSVVKDKLKEAVLNKPVIVHVKELNNDRLSVELYDINGKHITLNTMMLNTERISPICPLPILHRTEEIVVSVINESGLWFQKTNDLDQLPTLSMQLLKFYNTRGNLISAKVGSLCAALSKDGKWYRAKIVQLNESVHVNYIDYGNYETVSLDHIKILEKQFYVPHALCSNMPLANVESIPKSEYINILQELKLTSVTFMATFYNTNNKWSIELEVDGNKLSDQVNAIYKRNKSKISEEKVTSGVNELGKIRSQQIGQKVAVLVSHADSPTRFWLQYTDSITDLNNVQMKLQIAANESEEIKGVVLEPKDLCLAKYMLDNNWYRAEVLDADTEITTVRYIDYGNTDVFEHNKVPLRCLPVEYNEDAFKPFAKPYWLDLIPAQKENDFSKEACDRFRQLTLFSKNISAIILSDDSQDNIKCELYQGESNIGEILIKENLASPHTELEDELVDDNINEKEYDPRSAYVSDFQTLNHFYIQEARHVADLETICDRLLVADMQPRLEDVKVGMLCIAKYSLDGLYYRAKVLDETPNGPKVIFIDYGNEGLTTDIRIISDDVAAYPELVRKCKLLLPDSVTEWPEDANLIFNDLAKEGKTTFLLNVVSTEDGISLVRLTLEDEDVSDIILRKCNEKIEKESATCVGKQLDNERLPPLGEENVPSVLISHVISPADFWVQFTDDIPELDALAESLAHADRFPLINTFEPGTMCCAINREGVRSRAKLVKASEKNMQFELFFPDYGYTEIDTRDLKVLPAEAMKTKYLATHCSLKLPENVNEWSKEATNKFREISKSGRTFFQCEVLKEGDPKIVNLRLEGNDITESLAMLCHESNDLPENVNINDMINFTAQTKPLNLINSKDDKDVSNTDNNNKPVLPTIIADYSIDNNVGIKSDESENRMSFPMTNNDIHVPYDKLFVSSKK